MNIKYDDYRLVQGVWIRSKEYGIIQCGLMEQVVEYKGVKGVRRWIEEEGLGFVHGYTSFNFGNHGIVLNIKDNIEESLKEFRKEGIA